MVPETLQIRHKKMVELTGGSSAVLRGKFGQPGQLTISVDLRRHR